MKTINYFLLIFALFITACGIKPNTVSTPEGSEETVFPQTYPHNSQQD